jgi:hypothetical protein
VSLLNLLAVVALSTACCTQGRPPPGEGSAPARTAALPRASGLITVRGGETIELDGATVTVVQVSYLNEPCPPGMQCLHSGVIKQVEFRVRRGQAPVVATVVEGQRQVVDGVEVVVRAVRAGPEADVEASLPVAPAR